MTNKKDDEAVNQHSQKSGTPEAIREEDVSLKSEAVEEEIIAVQSASEHDKVKKSSTHFEKNDAAKKNVNIAKEEEKEKASSEVITPTKPILSKMTRKAARNLKKRYKVKKNRNLLLRFLKWISFTLIVLVVLIIGAVGYLLTTDRGLQLIVTNVNTYLSDYVQIGQAKGNISQTLSVQDLVVMPNQEQPMRFKKIELDWNLWALFHKQLHIHSLAVADVNLQFSPSKEVDKQEKPLSSEKSAYYPFSFKSISIPLEINIGKLEAENTKVSVKDIIDIDTDYLYSKELNYDGQDILVEELTAKTLITMPSLMKLPVKATLKGKVNVLNDQLKVHFHAYSEKATVQKNGFNFAVSSDFTGDLHELIVNLEGRVDWLEILHDPVLLHFNGVVVDQGGKVDADIKVKNLDNEIDLTALWEMAKPTTLAATLKMDALKLSRLHPDLQGRITSDIKVNGDLLQNPLIVGELNIDELKAIIPKREKTEELAEIAKTETAKTETAKTNIEIGLDAATEKHVGDKVATKVSPPVKSVERKAADVALATTEKTVDKTTDQSVTVKAALPKEKKHAKKSAKTEVADSANSRTKKVTNKKTASTKKVTPNTKAAPLIIEIKKLALDAKHNEKHQLKARLLVDALTVADLSVKSVDFDLDGQLDSIKDDAKKELFGIKEINTHLVVDAVKIGDLSVQSLTMDLEGELATELKGNIHVSQVKAKKTQQLVDNVDLKINGTLLGHHLSLTTTSPFGELELGGIGRLDNLNDSPNWTFYLDKTNISTPYAGKYELQKPAYVFVKEQLVILTSLCLNDLPFSFCAEGRQNDKNIVGTITLRNLSSSYLKPYLPKELQIDTAFNAVISGQYKGDDDFIGVADMSLTKGKIVYQFRGREVEIPLKTTALQAYANSEGVNTSLAIDWGHYFRAKGTGSLHDIFSDNPSINADLETDVPEFDWIAPLFPYLKDISGKIGANAKIHGPLKKPIFNAEFGIRKGNVRIDGLNSSLQDINILATMKDKSPLIDLKGDLKAGAGKLTIDGKYDLANLNAKINVKGNNLMLANSENIKAIVTPDIIFSATKDKNRLTGTVTIPEFSYLHKDMGSGRGSVKGVSPDAVIISDKDAKKESSFMSKLEMDFGVLLGDKIAVGMSGFLGNLNGKLRLQKEMNQPMKGVGSIGIGSGEYNIYGQRLSLDKGEVKFSGGLLTNPYIEFEATREFDNDSSGRKTKVGVKAMGSLRNLKVKLFSQPTLPEMSIASYLFLGRAPDSSSQSENLMLLDMVRKIAMGQEPISDGIAGQIGLTSLGLTQDRTGKAAFGIGKQINDNLYVGVGVGIFEEGAFATLRYKFLKHFNLDGQFSSDDTGVDVIYSKEL